jgi:hypothetical protein
MDLRTVARGLTMHSLVAGAACHRATDCHRDWAPCCSRWDDHGLRSFDSRCIQLLGVKRHQQIRDRPNDHEHDALHTQDNHNHISAHARRPRDHGCSMRFRRASAWDAFTPSGTQRGTWRSGSAVASGAAALAMPHIAGVEGITESDGLRIHLSAVGLYASGSTTS